MKRREFLKHLALSCGSVLCPVGDSVAEPVLRHLDGWSEAPETLERDIPRVPREFRGVWVATVENIDFPSSRRLTPEEQQSELRAIFDLAQALGFNAVIFQVRPMCDALYASPYEPWSEYLCGVMGRPPEPFYDPLAYASEIAHARGLELHAWFNPFRALHRARQGGVDPQHIARRRPDLAKPYGRYHWLDPGEPEARAHSCRVILDVVERYDIDAVHFDDYFYPYKERLVSGHLISFPDDDSWARYGHGKTWRARDDWRRHNINQFLSEVAAGIRRLKPHVKFGISPFGIWQPDHPPGIQGLNSYMELCSDSRRWLTDGLVDYLAPQLYWPIERERQSYLRLLEWWLSQNRQRRHVWPGSAAFKVADGTPRAVPAQEIAAQIKLSRRLNRHGGNIHFSFRVFRHNRGGLSDLLQHEVYSVPALVPASPWLDAAVLPAPRLEVGMASTPGRPVAVWQSGDGLPVARWCIAIQTGETWELQIQPATQRQVALPESARAVAVWPVSRSGVEGRRAILWRA
ncbi:family 10 glycosylhydrolase [Chloracidobacterium sp. MS 40/45]|uniref:glycoside hydrolase family 10 protein n=1 Tax=Chloracidobacterium aggregatum TaxID=2851959 RepID=UPI001B8ADF02|nr:family 10 glycosylhydrolase [Chloracidobacterium aggregatum]QUW00902.1 family 10 glycosylhydrolase [Chloracidobacterium sp. MS 40/45]